MNKEEKQAMLDVLRRQYKEQREQLAAIDQRLVEYYDGMCADVSGDGDPQLLHNGMEIAGAVKFLRLLRTYDFDHTTVADVICRGMSLLGIEVPERM